MAAKTKKNETLLEDNDCDEDEHRNSAKPTGDDVTEDGNGAIKPDVKNSGLRSLYHNFVLMVSFCGLCILCKYWSIVEA